MNQSANHNASGDTIHSVIQGDNIQVTNNFYNTYYPQVHTDVEPDSTLSPTEFMERYQQALQVDTEIAQMQILGMTYALNVVDIYVKVSVVTTSNSSALNTSGKKERCP